MTASGATIIGKTNCDEFGMGYTPLGASHLALLTDLT